MKAACRTWVFGKANVHNLVAVSILAYGHLSPPTSYVCNDMVGKICVLHCGVFEVKSWLFVLARDYAIGATISSSNK